MLRKRPRLSGSDAADFQAWVKTRRGWGCQGRGRKLPCWERKGWGHLAPGWSETEGVGPGSGAGAEPAARTGEGVTCAGRRPVRSPDPRPPHSRSARESEDEDEEEEERRPSASRGCTLQYQHATLQVFTQFHTTSSEGADQVVPMLGPDWLVEVTDLVSDFMRVGDPRVARMVDSSTLAGLEPGTTPFKVGTGAPCG